MFKEQTKRCRLKFEYERNGITVTVEVTGKAARTLWRLYAAGKCGLTHLEGVHSEDCLLSLPTHIHYLRKKYGLVISGERVKLSSRDGTVYIKRYRLETPIKLALHGGASW